jgi:hypothetical protein
MYQHRTTETHDMTSQIVIQLLGRSLKRSVFQPACSSHGKSRVGSAMGKAGSRVTSVTVLLGLQHDLVGYAFQVTAPGCARTYHPNTICAAPCTHCDSTACAAQGHPSSVGSSSLASNCKSIRQMSNLELPPPGSFTGLHAARHTRVSHRMTASLSLFACRIRQLPSPSQENRGVST